MIVIDIDVSSHLPEICFWVLLCQLSLLFYIAFSCGLYFLD